MIHGSAPSSIGFLKVHATGGGAVVPLCEAFEHAASATTRASGENRVLRIKCIDKLELIEDRGPGPPRTAGSCSR